MIEIGNDWLKILEGKPLPSGVVITKAGFSKLASIKEPIGTALSTILKELRLNKRSALLCLPRHLATLRILELPSTDAKEIDGIINLQVGKQTPYKKEEILSDHKIIDVSREGFTNVMVAIVRRNIINERVTALQSAGIEIEKATLSSEGLCNWFDTVFMPGLKLEASQAVVLVDIDSNYSDFIIFNRGKAAFTRNILIGASQLPGDIQNWQDKLFEEIRRSIELYQAKERNIIVTKLFLSGAGKNIKDLVLFLNNRLRLPVEALDPLKDIQLKKGTNIIPKDVFDSVSISPLLGLIMKGKKPVLDLTPTEVRIQKMMEQKRRQLTIMGVLVASIVMLSTLLLLINVYNKNLYLEQLKEISGNIENEAMEVERMRMKIGLIQGRLDAKGSSVNILDEIYKLTPREIYLTSIDIEEKKEAVLKGRASAMSHVFKFITTLEESPYFENVKTTHTTTKKDKEREFAEFEIICAYQRRL